MRTAFHPGAARRHSLRIAYAVALLTAAMLPAGARAECVCAIQHASASLRFEGGALPASLPCGARILASDTGELELAGGMRLTLAAGASFALPAAICGKERGETPSAAVSGIVRLLAATAQTVQLRDSIPAGLRGAEAEAARAVILRVAGTVELRGKGEPPMPAQRDLTLMDGETLRTGADGFAELVLRDGSHVLIGAAQTFDPRALPH